MEFIGSSDTAELIAARTESRGPAYRRWLGRHFGTLLGSGVAFRVLTMAACTKTASGKRTPIINLAARGANPVGS